MRRDSVLMQLEQEWRAAVACLPREELAQPGWLRMPWRPAALFAELEDVRHEWQELREWKALRDHAESKVNPGWTYKDLLAHLASWAQEFYREVEQVAEGREFDYEIPFEPKIGPTEWNAIEVAKRKCMTLDEIFDQHDTATARLQELVLKLPKELLTSETRFPIRMGTDPLVGNIARIAGMKCFHNHYHFAQIRERLAALMEETRG